MDSTESTEWLAGRFEENRRHLRAVAFRMLGSLSEADDAVQESWLRLSRQPDDRVDAIANLTAWLTTVVARVALEMLRTRRREESLESARVPEPIISPETGLDPEHEALLADSVGLALLVVLETLKPAERLAFVLHDMFAVPFEQIADIVDKSPAAARQLASRARRRVQGADAVPDPDLNRQKEVVRAFSAASRGGDFAALVAVLDPDVVLRADYGTLPAGLRLLRGAEAVAKQALMFGRFSVNAHPALVNGAPGRVTIVDGKPVAVMGFTVVEGRIKEIDILADPERLAVIDVTVFEA
ncbi:sigma-70 family RNA polymerase sigma factor [Catenulispora sp. NF23]|uniref:sigma-70 family RNA polymerase sigma factor n=1 Tax=Catenulispora pinistramenti TaxID=2705254 RepID=UPI001BA6FC5C|nr:sigma-70 family RNA polymerase sigma factor [Catenulispora pinistramenti]MBS2536144.1 sigma-70 family RNA polymerase sigma factor [Catenulispora pinistramenti]